MSTLIERFAAALLIWALAAAALAAPGDGVIRLVVIYPAGGGSDNVARLIAKRMSESMGQPVIVENRPGASGRIAAEYVKRAPPDGTTLMIANTAAMVVGPLVVKNVPFDPVADFAPVSQVFEYDLAFSVAASVPASTLAEYRTWAAANPRNATFGSAAAGGLGHFLGLQAGRALNVSLTHVGYKGSAPLLADLVGGHIPATIDVLDGLLRTRDSGRFRILATTGLRRSPFLPEVPTFAELGHPEVTGAGWFGIFAPARTPGSSVSRLHREIVKALGNPEVGEQVRRMAFTVTGTTPEAFARILEQDREKWGAMIRASGVVMDE
jgi:tripartite-type tricarboxylate transporter receptor subunit TctC